MSTSVRPVFRGQPRWVIPVLLGILVAAAVLYTWNIGYSGLSNYYASAVKSMLENPRAGFFGSLDPGATTSLDKLTGFLVPQALSASLFGFHAWALSLPQAIEGVVTVLASYIIGTRWRGPVVGVIVAGLAAFTPMLAAMFGRPMEDGMLTMCVVLAFAAGQRALMQQSLLWLCAAGAWVALGFQAKMLQAWLIVPAILLTYLLAARLPLRSRIVHVLVAGGVTVVLSLSWMTAIQLVPSTARPFIDGTTSNNVYSMVFGYNGVDRLLPNAIPGAVPQLNSTPGSGQSPTNSTATSNSAFSLTKLVRAPLATQLGWLYPLAFAGLIFEWLAWRRARRPGASAWDDRSAIALGLGIWLGVTAVVMSVAFVPHATYLAGMAVPLCAFAVSGAHGLRSLYGRATRVWLVLPAAVFVETGWATWIVLQDGPALRWLAPILAAAGLLGAVLLILPRLRSGVARSNSQVIRAALALSLVAALAGPVTWSLCVLGPGGGGSASDAFAGPRPGVQRPGVQRPRLPHTPGHRGAPTASGVHLRAPFTAPPTHGLDRQQRILMRYIHSHDDSSRITFATDTMAVAVSVILATDDRPMPIGGFSRRAPSPDVAMLRSLIDSGALRFVLLADYRSSEPAPGNPTTAADRAFVKRTCRAVLSGRFREGKSARQTLYDCGPPPALR